MLFGNWYKTAQLWFGKPQKAWTPLERAQGRASPLPHPYRSSQPGDSQDLINLNPKQSDFLPKEPGRSRRIDGSAQKSPPQHHSFHPRGNSLPPAASLGTLGDVHQSHCHLQRGQVTLRGFGEGVWAAVLTKSSISMTRSMQRFVTKSHHFCQPPKGDTEWLQSSDITNSGCQLPLIPALTQKKNYNQLPLQFFRKPGNSLHLTEGDCSSSNSFCIICEELWFFPWQWWIVEGSFYFGNLRHLSDIDSGGLAPVPPRREALLSLFQVSHGHFKCFAWGQEWVTGRTRTFLTLLPTPAHENNCNNSWQPRNLWQNLRSSWSEPTGQRILQL